MSVLPGEALWPMPRLLRNRSGHLRSGTAEHRAALQRARDLLAAGWTVSDTAREVQIIREDLYRRIKAENWFVARGRKSRKNPEATVPPAPAAAGPVPAPVAVILPPLDGKQPLQRLVTTLLWSVESYAAWAAENPSALGKVADAAANGIKALATAMALDDEAKKQVGRPAWISEAIRELQDVEVRPEPTEHEMGVVPDTDPEPDA